MKRNIYFVIIFMLFFSGVPFLSGEEQEDPYIWLEEIQGEKALEWVYAHNNSTTSILKKHPEFQEINKKILDILNSKDRIAYPSIRGDYVYNFWQDETNERGLWRRTPLIKYINNAPEWETLLDLDILSKEEGEKWDGEVGFLSDARDGREWFD